jgi:hypothetical protein
MGGAFCLGVKVARAKQAENDGQEVSHWPMACNIVYALLMHSI